MASRSLFSLWIAALLAATTLSCGLPAGILTRNAVVLFRVPRPVPNKVRHPYRVDARLAVLWVGQATALIQLDDKLILTDPVFTDTVGQGSRRLVEPGLDPRDLP